LTGAAAMQMIETEDLSKNYDGLLAVDRLNLRIQEGERFGLLGPNGAGKSTTLLMLTTLLRPTSGTARVNGFDVVRQPARVRRSIGVVFQDPSSDDTLTGYENLKLHGMLYGMPAALREQRIGELLELVELTARKDDVVKHYSGGMRRRLELARGLLHQPKVLFLDEPTLGLDPQSREHIWRYIERLSHEQRTTMVLTTHYMEEVDQLCDRLAIMDAGRIVALDTPAALKQVIGGDVVVLQVDDTNLDRLQRLGYVTKIDRQQGMLYLTVTNAGVHLPEILQTAGAVASVAVRSPTLNDVFLHYTGKEIHDESPEGGWAERSMHYSSRTR
jgi:ABC-2 type transport system ATP-binding protein